MIVIVPVALAEHEHIFMTVRASISYTFRHRVRFNPLVPTGKILQERSSISTNNRGSSTNQSLQLDLALPTSKIATLSSGEFVGITADRPDQPMPLKAFHCKIVLNIQAAHQDKPMPPRKVSKETIDQTFQQIRNEVSLLVDDRLDHMRKSLTLAKLIINPKVGARRKSKLNYDQIIHRSSLEGIRR